MPSSQTPDYKIRISQRAKRMQLKVSPLGTIEVVLPKNMNARHVPLFVAEHQHWIEQTQKQMAALYPPEELLPGSLDFAATNQQWQLKYLEGKRARVAEINNALSVYSQDDNGAQKALQQWLNRRADEVLIPWLHNVSDELALTFKRAIVRAQKTRWGSCSSNGTISINRALLFMPPETVRYLFIHELCHTKEMNHSARYWALVESYMPNYQQHEQILSKGMRLIPRWALIT
ncbi:Putative predicted metal-dependent hydrolase [hydrothermal vent metagenome]|uniref:Predicted metal-dependent hydrolase n=1 Tax=hydrothermal vent metagenome TaxID=652676 RepID=A0A3B0ZTN0_9ZZZZ